MFLLGCRHLEKKARNGWTLLIHHNFDFFFVDRASKIPKQTASVGLEGRKTTERDAFAHARPAYHWVLAAVQIMWRPLFGHGGYIHI